MRNISSAELDWEAEALLKGARTRERERERSLFIILSRVFFGTLPSLSACGDKGLMRQKVFINELFMQLALHRSRGLRS